MERMGLSSNDLAYDHGFPEAKPALGLSSTCANKFPLALKPADVEFAAPCNQEPISGKELLKL